MSFLTAAVLLASAIAVVTDVRTRRIPNWLTFGLAAVALGNGAMHGIVPALETAGIYITVMALGLLAFSLGWLGGGDVKLLAAASAAFGFPDCIAFVIYTSIGGGIIAVAVSLAQGRLFTVFRGAFNVLRPLAVRGTVAIAPSAPTMLPYGCAIALGATVVALANSVAPYLRLPI